MGPKLHVAKDSKELGDDISRHVDKLKNPNTDNSIGQHPAFRELK